MLATLEEQSTGASADRALEGDADAQVGEHLQVTVLGCPVDPREAHGPASV
jgi:hypothetical protein